MEGFGAAEGFRLRDHCFATENRAAKEWLMAAKIIAF
jgi:hypothetical protein